MRHQLIVQTPEGVAPSVGLKGRAALVLVDFPVAMNRKNWGKIVRRWRWVAVVLSWLKRRDSCLEATISGEDYDGTKYDNVFGENWLNAEVSEWRKLRGTSLGNRENEPYSSGWTTEQVSDKKRQGKYGAEKEKWRIAQEPKLNQGISKSGCHQPVEEGKEKTKK